MFYELPEYATKPKYLRLPPLFEGFRETSNIQWNCFSATGLSGKALLRLSAREGRGFGLSRLSRSLSDVIIGHIIREMLEKIFPTEPGSF